MVSEYSYVFTELAEKDLDDVLGYISGDLQNPEAASALGKKIFERIEVLRFYPEAGTLVENEHLPDKQVRKLLVDNYIIYYKPIAAERVVHILRVVYGYRDPDTIARTIK